MATQFNDEGTIQFTDGVPLPGDSRINALLNAWDIKWGGAVGTGVTITYSFPGSTAFWDASYSDDDEPSDMTKLNASQQAAFEAALQTWADVADLTFVEITDGDAPGDVAVMRAAIYDDMPDASGWGYLPGFFANAGDVWLHPLDFLDPEQLAPGSYGFSTLIHETGHALGLNHPNDNGFEPGFDNRTTIMSYNPHPYSLFREVTPTGGGGYTWSYEDVSPETPMPRDILAIQYLYGANMDHATGDDVYTFDPGTPFIKTIWDAGGTDTISVANFTLDCKIDLGAGRFSNITIPSDPFPDDFDDGMEGVYDGRSNLAIAYNVTIENAIGGSGSDNLLGNGAANVLAGGAGNDKLNGKGGTDELEGGSGNDTYTIDSGAEIDTATADSGIDLVKSKVTYALGPEQENLKLLGTAASNGTGNAGANAVTGNGSSNVLAGAGGDDTLTGGLGKDTLSGGSGTDIFRFDVKAGGKNADVVADFMPGEDLVYLSDAVFVQLVEAIGNDAEFGPVSLTPGQFEANATGIALQAGDRILYNTTTGDLYYDSDGTGPAAARKFATFNDAPDLDADDILVYAG